MRPDQLERRLRERLDALGPAPSAELLHVLMLPDLERADRIGEFWGNPETRTFGELLIDCEEKPDAPGGAGRDAARIRALTGQVKVKTLMTVERTLRRRDRKRRTNASRRVSSGSRSLVRCSGS
jgi:hypothetical protein